MCLAIPAKVKSINGSEAEVEVGGVSRKASIVLTPEAKVGDYVLLHTGYAINVVDEEEAQETLKIFQEIAEAEAEDSTDKFT
jgi:hydrogenase expression/formation protein HypC